MGKELNYVTLQIYHHLISCLYFVLLYSNKCGGLFTMSIEKSQLQMNMFMSEISVGLVSRCLDKINQYLL